MSIDIFLNPRTNNRELINPRNSDKKIQCQPLILIQDKVAQSLDQEKDSRHLALPAIGDEVCPEDRFQAPPSRFQCSYEASKCMLVAEKAKKTGKYTGSVLPVGYGCVKKEEMCILPDGTVYKLSATWVPDPSFQILKSEGHTDRRASSSTNQYANRG
ncbi:Hypothetical predicted protein [Mytilus galloprovincialis]|uniref:Uncharacterized protein n=1 Tax=Mytilus galloprovincialis TaxID=29158 RepID=A0A8B6BFJ0_MYTGA|nr:Hypothetical predicted protein [Mytilus galloprovincialis]